ncbi:MAG TPA: hypothetical protein VN903_04410 [Polyangia bacterium]|jgi:hypothetical protein|nr:hypothetical protein [Polyangia bacterium]
MSRFLSSARGQIAVVALGLNLFACAAGREPQRSAEEAEPRTSALDTPAVGPEFQFDAPVRVAWDGPGIGIAAGASNYLFVWRTDSDIYGTRVGFDGTLVDQLPFRLTPDARTQKVARVAFNGTDWLVAYSDDDGGGAVQVAATRVAADGTVRDPNGVAVTTGTGDHLLQDVASDGSGFLVTWYASGIQAALVSAAGAAQAPFMVGSATPSGPAGFSAAAFNGSEYLVAYYEVVGANRYLRARRVSRAGALVGATIELGTPAAAVSLVDVANDGTSWLVSYVSDALRWQVVAADGTLGGSGSIAGTFGGLTTDPVSRLSATGTGGAFTLCTIQDTALLVVRINASGALNATSMPVVSGDVFEVAVARAAGSDYVAYTAATPSASSAPARGVRLDTSLGFAASPSVLSFHANGQDMPHAAFNGTDYLVVWNDLRGAQSAAPGGLWLGPAAGTVYGRRMSPSGQLLGSSSFTIAPVGGGVNGLFPDVGSNGTDYLVVWKGGDVADGLYARRVTAAGAVVDTNAIPIDLTAGDKRFPSVASNGTDYYVAWSLASKEIRGARVLANGTMPSAPTTFATGVLEIDNPAVAFNGTNYLVAWGEGGDIMASRVNPATGALLDTTRIKVAADSSIVEYRPAVASNGTDWLVVWDARRDIRAARVAADGTVKDPNGITIDAGSDLQIGVEVAWAGNFYWVTWSAPNNIIPAKRVAADGTVMDATGIPIVSGTYYLVSGPLVDVASAGGDRALFLYPRYELTRNSNSRAFGVIVPSPAGAGGAGGSGGSTGAGGAAGTGGATGAGGAAGRGGATGGGGAAGRGGAGGTAGAGGTSVTGGASGGSTAGGSGAGGRGGAAGASGGSTAGGSGAGGRGGAAGSGVGSGGAAAGGATGGSAVAGAGSKAGCSCSHAPGSSSPGSLAFILLGLWLRRRARLSRRTTRASAGTSRG